MASLIETRPSVVQQQGLIVPQQQELLPVTFRPIHENGVVTEQVINGPPLELRVRVIVDQTGEEEGLVIKVLNMSDVEGDVPRALEKFEEKNKFWRKHGFETFQVGLCRFTSRWDEDRWVGVRALENARELGGYGSD
tara:strand:- start:667 stop:1077 length:411 start_codon:yes stop_codon:yes gene_type:complete